jgi:hypothetical protein
MNLTGNKAKAIAFCHKTGTILLKIRTISVFVLS